MKIKRPSPLVQMTLALVSMCGMLVILADLFFGVLPDSGEQAMRWRKHVSEALAVQVAVLLQADDLRPVQRTLDGVVARTEGLKSLAIRRDDGRIVAQAGDHARHWRSVSGEVSVPEQVTVSLHSGSGRWGSFELAFAQEASHPVIAFLRQPLVRLLGFISFAGTLAFGLYLRRALQHLDPASVVPDRVQGAFDAMAEGVVVMDARGRVLLTNRSFRALHVDAATLRVGQSLSALPWLAQGLPADVEAHPWARALAAHSAHSGTTLEIGHGGHGGHGGADARHLVVNCVPITDPGGAVRGCLATFDDVSQLHRSNEALRLANDALSESQQEVQRQNTELQRLATRDPMTGCLNRRAFHAALNEMLASSRASGEALSCVMVDIDHFKSVNDTHGHAIGDRVIQEVAKKLVASARASDLVCRYGGEEFCVVLHGSTLAAAQEFGERVRRRIEAECGMAVREVPGMRVTASLGLAVLSDAQTPAPKLIDQADQALYRAKRGGRNRVCAYATASESESAPAPDPASSDRSGTTASQHGADCPTTEGVVA